MMQNIYNQAKIKKCKTKKDKPVKNIKVYVCLQNKL